MVFAGANFKSGLRPVPRESGRIDTERPAAVAAGGSIKPKSSLERRLQGLDFLRQDPKISSSSASVMQDIVLQT